MGKLNGFIHYMKVRTNEKPLFKLTFKRKVVTSMLEYNCFDYFFEVLFSNITVWILLWILTIFKYFCFEYFGECYPEILRQSKFNWETKISGRVHEILSEKVTGLWNI